MVDDSRNRLILVVDDEERICPFRPVEPGTRWFRVVEAYRRMQALDKVRTEMPDLVILDVMMPDVDGFEVLKTIRRASTVPVIMLTAKGRG